MIWKAMALRVGSHLVIRGLDSKPAKDAVKKGLDVAKTFTKPKKEKPKKVTGRVKILQLQDQVDLLREQNSRQKDTMELMEERIDQLEMKEDLGEDHYPSGNATDPAPVRDNPPEDGPVAVSPVVNKPDTRRVSKENWSPWNDK